MPALHARATLVAFASLVSAASAFAQKPPLDHSVYDGWNSIRTLAVSRDGAWVLYVVTPQEGDANAVIQTADGNRRIEVPRASSIQFTWDSKHVVAMQAPPFADIKKAKRAKTKPEDMPKSAFLIVDLATGGIRKVASVQSFILPQEDSGWILYKPEPPKEAPPARPAAKKADVEEDQASKTATPTPPDSGKDGDPYELLDLSNGHEERLEKVDAVSFDQKGDVLAYSVKTKDEKGDGLFYYDLRTKTKTKIFGGDGHYPTIQLSPEGHFLAFISDRDDFKSKKPALSLYFSEPLKPPVRTARIGLDSMPKDWAIHGGYLSFSHDGSRLLYRVSPKPQADPDPKPDDENVSVDIWNWKDDQLQTQQLIEAKEERDRGYLAIYDLRLRRTTKIGDRATPDPIVSNRGDGRFALAVDTRRYEREASWSPGLIDAYAIDLDNGKRTPLANRFPGEATLSVTGKYAVLYDGIKKEWTAVDLASGRRGSLSAGIPFPVADELDDHPDQTPAYGIEGWTSTDGRAIIADRFDLWSCDPTGKSAPVRLTNGRPSFTRYRPIRLDPEAHFLDPSDLTLSTFNEETKYGGLAKLTATGLVNVVSGPKTFSAFTKAKDASTLLFTRQDFVEFPDVWVTHDLDFKGATKISDANPQQKKYNWGTAQLVQWTSLDGIPLKGILVRPENFDYGKKYPLIAYFYERMSDSLYHYMPPAPSASTINWSYFASNGYCVFIPDIPYKVGFPGESAINAILPGIQSIVGRGYIDSKRIGIQGQSWGGYQVAYMVTRTNMFACAEAGAPVADMFSAYGGIRYGSGVVREFQYEHGQSRIGGTPWDSTLRYVENSPVFWADKIETPLMIMSNDKDGAVPHTQGIELFTALRRLDKPCWMVVYNEEDHNLVQRKNRKDLSIRLSQFFDHYLKGAPMPIWMSKGVPAVDKGRTMGTELESGK